jgi:hypothetical protein
LIPPATEFDPIAVGDRIAGHIAEANKAIDAYREHSVAAGTLLLDVQKNHPQHLDAICKRIGLGRSRRAELLAIAGGRKTLAQSKAQNKARVKKHRAQKKAAALPPAPPSENPLHRAVMDDPFEPATRENGVDPEASADAVETAHAAAEAPTEPGFEGPKSSKAGKGWKNSEKAFAEFKFAVDHWLTQMSAEDTAKAIAYAKMVGDHHVAKIRKIAA